VQYQKFDGWSRLVWHNFVQSWSSRAPFDHIWAMVWSGARGNITI